MNRHTVQFGSPYGIFLDTNGEWVRYIDHQQRIAALEARIELLEDVLRDLLGQVKAFVEQYGEADFETGRAVVALGEG
jgi:hypothetical protein